MSLLRELIVRYVSWIQTGGQRMSLAGLDSLTREDTFDIEEEDVWDFGVRLFGVCASGLFTGQLISFPNSLVFGR